MSNDGNILHRVRQAIHRDQWAWSGNHYADGPFDTRAEAIADAQRCGEDAVEVGHVEWLDPAAYVDVDLGAMIDATEERAHDQAGWDGDELIVDRVRPGTGTDAAEQLALALQSWASEWLRSVAWRLADRRETVTLDSLEEESDE